MVKRPTIKREVDRLVFNVEKTALSEGNMMDVLRSTPGVIVLDNAISVKNSSPTVYINDRKVHLSSGELVELLEGTSATNIKSVEVITNPPARYDAESGVVLNIVMSKNLVTGYSGSLFSNYTQGVFPKTNYGMSNFCKGSKISLFSSYSYNDRKIDRVGREHVNYPDQQWDSDLDRNIWSETHNAGLNLDIDFDNHNTLSLSANMLFLPYYKFIVKNNTVITDFQDVQLSRFRANNLSRDKKQNLGFDMNYAHTFKKDNARLSLSSHFTIYDYKRNQRVDSDYFSADNQFVERNAYKTRADQDTEIFTSQLDYSLPVNERESFETGVKFTNIKTDSGLLQKDIDTQTGEETINNQNTDAFDYMENVYAAYASYSRQWEKWNVAFGLRVEQTNIEGQSISTTSNSDQDYLEWFPTVNIGFNASDDVSIYSNYKRSLQRPDYSDLNPFKFFLNDFTVVTGNPSLRPVFTDHIVLGASINERFTVEAYYKKYTNNIFELPLQDNINNVITYTPLNIDVTHEYGFDFITYFDVTEKWFVYFVTSFYNTKDELQFLGTNVERDQWSNYSILSNDFSFLKDNSLVANFTMVYVGKNIQGLQVVDTRVVSELSIKKTMFKGKGILSLTVNDLFNDQDFFVRTRILDELDSSIYNNLDNRYVRLGFRYNFGNTRLSTNERSSTTDERNRLEDD